MPAVNPKTFCLDQIARRAGNRTYLKVRLDLKAEQMTAWNAFAKASDDADVKDTARCNALPTEMKERPNYVDRLTLEENVMKARVERIEAVKPTLLAFYNTLSPEQKVVLDRPRPMADGPRRPSRRSAVTDASLAHLCLLSAREAGEREGPTRSAGKVRWCCDLTRFPISGTCGPPHPPPRFARVTSLSPV